MAEYEPAKPKTTASGQQMVNLYSYADVLFNAGKIGKAKAVCELIIQRNPNHAHTLNLLGLIAQQTGRDDLAVDYITMAIGRKPFIGGFYCNLSNSFQNLGRLKEAVSACLRAIDMDPNLVEAYVSLGNALDRMGKLKDAESVLRKAVAINPKIAESYNNLGFLLWKQARLEEAKAVLRKGIEIKPSLAQLFIHLANTLREQLKIDEAILCFRNAIKIESNNAVHSNLLFLLNFNQDYTPKAIFEKHQRWAENVAVPLISSDQFFNNNPDLERRLRIGYVSPDFRLHPVMSFIEPVLANHDHNNFEVFCYSGTSRSDMLTDRVKCMVDKWRDIYGMSDEYVADIVRNDKIDILVDLAGHTANNRILVFARKPSPIQVAYLGYPNTTGLPNVDYRITDSYADPENLTDHLYSEELMRLPGCFCCYQPPSLSLEVNSLPALKTGKITFGCLNDPLRINKSVVSVWSEILKMVGGSQLILQARQKTDEGAKGRLTELFDRNGISGERIRIVDFKPFSEHLRLYNNIDITLDTFPFNGHTNTCNSLWMGVPVVVLRGQNYISRMGNSLLSNAGLSDLIAGSKHEYIHKAVKLSHDFELLQKLRVSLRAMIAGSNLTDAKLFTGSIEKAFRQMWRNWCKRKILHPRAPIN